VVARIFEPAWDLYEGSVRLRTFRDLCRSQWYEPGRLQELRSQGLQRLVAHAAATSPFYRERFAAAGIDPGSVRDLTDLQNLPLLTKADIRKRLPDILSSRYRRGDLEHSKTGGSTGVSLEIYCDRRGVQQRNGAAQRVDCWSGWRPGEPKASVWGNPPVPRTWKQKLRQVLKDRFFYLDTMKIDAAAIDRFLAEWRHWRPGLLFGHAHSLFILAEELEARGVTLRPHGIISTSMMLMQLEREVIERVFGVPVTNRYGCEEVSLIGCECEQHDGLHINAEHVWVEFLRDDDTPCLPGEEGRIVVTELINYGMPMIRYEIGDQGVPSDRTCRCGRFLPLMESVTGRTADFLRASNGSRVAGISLIENTLTDLPGIRQLQLIQAAPLHLDVNLVPGAAYDEDTGRELMARLKGYLGAELEITLHLVDAIEQEPSGKYRFSICKVDG